MLGKCVGNTLQICATTRQHDAVGQFLIEACILDLLDHQIGDVLHASLDYGRQIALQDHLLAFRGVVADTCVLLDVGSHSVTVLHLHLLDPTFGDTERANIGIDSVRTDRNRRHIAYYIVEIDRNVGHIGTHIDHCDTLLFLVRFEQGLGRNQRINVDSQRLDTQLQHRICQALNGGTQAQNEVEGRREAFAERADRIGHLFVAIDDEILGDTLQNHLVFARCAHLLHTRIEFVDIALADAVRVVAHSHPIVMAGAADKLARNAKIGLEHLDIQLFLELIDGRFERLGRKFDIVDRATADALRLLAYDCLNHHFAVGTAHCRCCGHVVRAEVNCHYVVLLFHVYIFFRFSSK